MTLSPTVFSAVGLVAAGFSALTFFPQAVHTWQTRSANGFSGPMLAVGTVGCGLWLVYGVYFHNLPVLFGNSINLFSRCCWSSLSITSGSLASLKNRFRRKKLSFSLGGRSVLRIVNDRLQYVKGVLTR